VSLREIEEDVVPILRQLILHPKKSIKVLEKNPLEPDTLHEIHDLVIAKEKTLPNLISLGEPFKDVLIIGDTHGFMRSTISIIRPFLEQKVQSLLFLGDYVDRGPHSLANFLLILGLRLAWPERVMILRGNHEDLNLNARFGFREELRTYYPDMQILEKVESLIDEIYEYLSLAAITPYGTLAVHAGLPQDLETVEDINLIPKPHSALFLKFREKEQRLKYYRIFEQLRWNDPRADQEPAFTASRRGEGTFYFNETVVSEFLEHNNLARIVRAHESSRGGFENMFQGKLLHVFSTEPYYGKVPTAYTLHEQENGKTIVRNLSFQPIKGI